MAVSFVGLPQRVVAWSVDEDATSLDRGDSPSGVPQITASGAECIPEVMGLQEQPISVVSTDYGSTRMNMVDVSVSEGSWSITAGSPLHALVQIGQVQAGSGLRADKAVARFFDAVGVVEGTYTLIVEGLKDKLFDVPSYNSVVWAGMRQWLSANELDLNYIGDKLYLKPVGSKNIYLQDLSAGYGIDCKTGSLAKTIEVNVYHRQAFNAGLVFPGRETIYPDANEHFSDSTYNSISVGAGEVVETTLQLAAEVKSIRQPSMVTAIPVEHGKPNVPVSQYPNGIYMIVGKDNKRITPEQWKDLGGGLSVTLNEDHRSVTVRVSGMNYDALAPYRVAESDGSKDYCGLFIMGESGQYVDIETVRFDTGVGAKSKEVININNHSISSLTSAYHAAQASADRATGHALSFNWDGPDPVREKQSFGVLPGCRFMHGSHWWRVNSSSFSENGVSFEADQFTMLKDISVRYTRVRDLVPAGRSLRQLSNVGVL